MQLPVLELNNDNNFLAEAVLAKIWQYNMYQDKRILILYINTILPVLLFSYTPKMNMSCIDKCLAWKKKTEADDQ